MDRNVGPLESPVLLLKTPIHPKAWNVVWDSNNGNYTSDAQGIHVTYQKNEYGASAGVNFRAQPSSVFPCTSVTMAYKVYFPDDFDFVLGGKLPGVWGGEPGSGGGDWNDEGYSFRVMFREKGAAVAYVYLCTDQGKYDGDEKCPLVREQGKGFDDIAHHTNGAGIDLWREDGLQFKRGAWNDVEMSLTVNTPGKADGIVALKVNGKEKRFEGISWCKRRKDINGIAFASWMGGGSKKYAPKKNQKAIFKDFEIKSMT